MKKNKSSTIVVEKQYVGQEVSVVEKRLKHTETEVVESSLKLSETALRVLGELQRSMRRRVTPEGVKLLERSNSEVMITLESPGGIEYCLRVDTSQDNWKDFLARTVREVGFVGCS